jgi:DNA-directed RNA polymerase subunit delta
MTIALSKSKVEIGQMPLVELTFEILRAKKEPLYFREIMKEIQALRTMTDNEVNEVIARLYTEINIDGRFTCTGQNIWGLSRWYPVDKATERSSSSKKFVRRSGDAFSDDDEDDEEFDDVSADEDAEDSNPLFDSTDDADTEDADADAEAEPVDEEEAEETLPEEELDTEFEEEPLAEEEDEDEEEED